MNRFTFLIASSAVLAAASVSVPAFSQGAEQTVVLTEVKPTILAEGYRSSKVVGAKIYNDAKVNIGKIDDLIVTPKDTVPYAVLSVGGFLGMGKHYVVVPASSIEVVGGELTLHGGSLESLKALPSYTYTY